MLRDLNEGPPVAKSGPPTIRLLLESKNGQGMTTTAAVRRRIRRALIAAGILLVAILATGTVIDVMSFDRTSGGYDPPYTDYTGEPIDWTTVKTIKKKNKNYEKEVILTMKMHQFQNSF